MNAGIIIEKAVVSDIDAILDIERLCFGHDQFSKRQFLYLIKQAKGMFYVLKLKQQVAAYISLLTREGADSLRIYSVAVHPEARGNGLAQMLIDKSMELAAEHNLKTLSLEVRLDNAATIRLYEKNGFKKHSIIQNYYHDGSAAYKMLLKM